MDDLAAAARLLEEWGHTYRLVVVGDGPLRADLERGLPHALFMGTQQGADLARLYASADLFAFPSTTETFGNVVQEAFASGLPVVGVNSGGVPDLITCGWNGLLAAPNQPRDFARKLQLLLTTPALRQRLGRRALTGSTASGWAAVNGRLLASYRRLISGCGPQPEARALAA